MSLILVLGGMIVGIGIEFKIDRLVVDRLGLGIKEFLNRFIFLWYGLMVLELELLQLEGIQRLFDLDSSLTFEENDFLKKFVKVLVVCFVMIMVGLLEFKLRFVLLSEYFFDDRLRGVVTVDELFSLL